MKKLMIAVAIVCTMFAFPACGKNANNKTENNVNLTNNDVTTAQTEVTDEVPDETTSLTEALLKRYQMRLLIRLIRS